MCSGEDEHCRRLGAGQGAKAIQLGKARDKTGLFTSPQNLAGLGAAQTSCPIGRPIEGP